MVYLCTLSDVLFHSTDGWCLHVLGIRAHFEVGHVVNVSTLVLDNVSGL